jgi:hypothetical protein
MLLGDEISMGIEGEIDEQALEEKRGLFEKPSPANNVKRLRRYGRDERPPFEVTDPLRHQSRPSGCSSDGSRN